MAAAEAAAEVIWDLVVGSNPESLGCYSYNLRLCKGVTRELRISSRRAMPEAEGRLVAPARDHLGW